MRTLSQFLSLILFLPGSLFAQDWIAQSTGSTGSIRDISFFDGRHGVAAVWVFPGSSEILQTSDGGANWITSYSNINEGMTGAAWPSINSPVIVGGTSNFGRVYLSGNMGLSWNRVIDDPAPNPSFWCVNFPDERIGYAGGGSRMIFATTDSGGSWSKLPQTVGSGPGQIIALHFLSADTGWAILTTSANDFTNGSLLYRTVDGGKNWSEVEEFLVARSVHFVDAEVGYVTGSDGSGPVIWQTVNGGESWDPTRLKISNGLYLNDVDFAEDNRFIGYATGGNVFNESDGMVASTSDGGATWIIERDDLPVCLLAIDVPSQEAIYAAGSGGAVYRTEREWVKQPEPLSSISAEEIDLDTIVVGTQGMETIQLRAENVAGLRVDSIYLYDPTDDKYGLSPSIDRTLPAQILGVDSMTITLRAAPTDTGHIFAMLRIETNDIENSIREIRVVGYAGEEVTVEPVALLDRTAIDFDTVSVGDSARMSVLVTAGSSAKLTLSDLRLEGQDSLFRIVPSRALPTDLAEGETISFDLTFAPDDSGQHMAEIVLTTNAPSSPELFITLQGTGRLAPTDTSASVTYTNEVGSFEIRPNPTTDRIMIDLYLIRPGSVSIRLFDLTGRVLGVIEPRAHESGSIHHSVAVPSGFVGLCLVEVAVDEVVVGRGKVLVR